MARRRATSTDATGPLKRRDFLKAAGVGVGTVITAAAPAEAAPVSRFPAVSPPSTRVVVIGAGAFGGWTAYHLRKNHGVHVTLVDAYGPANSRATSGDESRGVRSSYGDKAAPVGELWSSWARRSMHLWPAFDREWGHDIKSQMFWRTGDLFMRSEWEPTIKRTREIWEKAKVPFEVLSPDECRYRWPQINVEDITAILHEPDAGVVRARRATQAVASIVTRALGVKLIISRAKLGPIVDGKMQEVTLLNGDRLRADVFVFACGPWLPKVFPELLGNRMRLPLGQVVYYGTPTGSDRFTYPNMPSYNFPGVTGWVALPEDSRGFRVRGTESIVRPSTPAGTGTAAAAGAAGTGAGRGAATATPPPAAAPPAGRPDSTAGRGGATAVTTARPPIDPAQSDPDTSVRWFDVNANTRQRDFVTHRFPDMKNAPVLETRCCHYEQTSSRNFIIDLMPGASNVWIAGGGNAEAFKSGPVIGEYVAHRVVGVHGDPDVATGFRIPKDEYAANDPTGRGGRGAADTTGRGGRAGTDTTGRGGRGGGDFVDEEII